MTHTCDKQKCENEYCLYRHHSLSVRTIKYNFNKIPTSNEKKCCQKCWVVPNQVNVKCDLDCNCHTPNKEKNGLEKALEAHRAMEYEKLFYEKGIVGGVDFLLASQKREIVEKLKGMKLPENKFTFKMEGGIDAVVRHNTIINRIIKILTEKGDE